MNSKICKHCQTKFITSKFHTTCQVYCTQAECKRERNKIRSKKFRNNNPDYFKKTDPEIADNSYRTEKHNPQRKLKRHIKRCVKGIIDQQEQVFVATSQTFAFKLDFVLKIVLGMTVLSLGGLRQTSAFMMSNLLNSAYKDGVSLINADANLKHKLEILYEHIREPDKPFSEKDFTEIL